MLQIKNTLGGGKPEGLYAWKKYNAKPSEIIVQENPSFTVDVVSSSNSSYVTITLNGDNEFLDRIDDSYFDGFTIKPTSTQSWFRYTNGVLYLTTSSTATTSNYKYHYDAKTHIITALQTGNYFGYTGSTSLSYSGTKTFELPILIGDFIDYIVSDKETAYPDGGEKGGYWYERVSDGLTPEMFGYTKMAIDKYTPTMDSYTNTLKVNHSLGEIPKRIFILVDMNDFQEDDSSNYLVFADIALNPNKKYMSSISRSSTFNMANYPWCGGYSEGAVSTSYNTSWNITSKLFIFNTSGSFKYKAGTEYTIISMA